ncbi:hypothetical protein VKT23_003879 [Stygiomarasmius scandens]|uniref:peptidylprolyl isomerase n=1 Tax=Marasmiellus scandens TaxID=2682957 RepID=A0ABR1K1C1_9AGAR
MHATAFVYNGMKHWRNFFMFFEGPQGSSLPNTVLLTIVASGKHLTDNKLLKYYKNLGQGRFFHQFLSMSVSIERIFSGDGRNYPESGDIVSIHYVGRLNDGSTFDSTYDRGRPFVVEIGIGKVIQGWDNGVPQLSKGEKVLMKVPPELAYGERGVPPIIPPNSTLTFEMELIDIVRPVT